MAERDFIADHVKPIGSSGIRRVFDLGASLKDPINLSIGQPDFVVPEPIKEAMIDAIRSDRNGYTVTRGLPELREAIAHQLKEQFHWEPDIMVTGGLSGGLLLALMACINPGDEVVFADPYFVSYKHLVRLVGGVPVIVDTYPDFRVNPERFEKVLTARTKMILLCSPSNPTGVVQREEDLKAICELAEERELLVVTDEIYEMLTYDGPAPSAVPFAPDRTILLRAFSKSFAMTGLRTGFAAGPETIITQMAKLQQYTFVCAPTPAQFGGLKAMSTDMSQQVNNYRDKRDLVCRLLDGRFEFVRPSGGFYVFPKAPARFSNATAFVEEAIKRNVLIIPGEVFSERDTHFRISYAASEAKIHQGCEILCALAAGN